MFAQFNQILNNLWMVLEQMYWFILILYMKHCCYRLHYENVSQNCWPFKPNFAWGVMFTCHGFCIDCFNKPL